MKKTMFVAAAALTGLLAGTAARAAVYAPTVAGDGHKSVSKTSQVTPDAGMKASLLDDTKGKHDCKGKNACKGQGGCKTDKNDCKGQNDCKGKGGCNTNKTL